MLRELQRGDAPDVLVFRSDPEEQRFNSEPLRTLEQSAALIDGSPGTRNQSAVPWALTLRESGRVIGLCGYNSWDRYHRRAEIGYDLAGCLGPGTRH